MVRPAFYRKGKEMNVFDTIAAVSTPRGKGGIAVIRISGPDALAIGDSVFRPKNKKPLSETESNYEVWGDIFAPDVDGGSVNIDDGMGVVFRAPRSFTGEDTVEISCHGGVLITEAVLEAVIAAGARPAMAGEFTRRAFISGRMTLTQAEALGDLLEAKNHRQMILSRTGVSGVLSRRIESLYSQMIDVLSSIYAKIDFPDEDLGDMGREEIEQTLLRIREEEAALAATYKIGKAVSEGIRTVICGRTNAGKSSLYNLIVGREAAIVTDIEGTTRDLLEETVSFGGVTLRICDTAGLRETDDKVESIGVERARGEIKGAEMILAVFDGTREPDEDDVKLAKELSESDATVIIILNKSDIDNGSCGMTDMLADAGFSSPIKMSAKNGDGRDTLAGEIERLFIDGSIDIKYDAVVADARQYAALIRSIERLDSAIFAMRDGFALDLCCIDAEGAMSELGEINGKNVSEDIVGAIFSRFCVGK